MSTATNWRFGNVAGRRIYSDGSNPHPFLAHPDQDYNASFSNDGNWIIFTTERNGSADIYQAHTDSPGLEQLTDNPATERYRSW